MMVAAFCQFIITFWRDTFCQYPGPAFFFQQGGGEKNLKRIQALIKTGKKGWKSETLQRFDPDYNSKIKEIKKASESGRIEFMHVQVFLGRDGSINTTVGNNNGIQWNNWK
ncbi:hypothetical protein [Yersinia wautersii]|uniref:hypothetical protein n=1 Tax=Yersinia wautersii TaxID=1341643 RepID=UPI0005B36FD7|nr:hypothetical protein [Yersinia wautersii]